MESSSTKRSIGKPSASFPDSKTAQFTKAGGRTANVMEKARRSGLTAPGTKAPGGRTRLMARANSGTSTGTSSKVSGKMIKPTATVG